MIRRPPRSPLFPSPTLSRSPTVRPLARGEKSFRGHAPDVPPGPPESARLHEGDPTAKLGPPDRGGESCRAAPHDRDVELAVLHAHFPWTVAPKPVSRVRWAAIWSGVTWRGS